MGMVCPNHGVVLTVQGMVSAENVYFCQMLSPRPVAGVAGHQFLKYAFRISARMSRGRFPVDRFVELFISNVLDLIFRNQ